MKNPDSLFARRQEIARQIQEMSFDGTGMYSRSNTGKLNRELIKVDSLLIYKYLLDYARNNQKLNASLLKLSNENLVLKKDINIHKNLIISRERTLQYLLALSLLLFILLSVFISLYFERFNRVRKLSRIVQKSNSEFIAIRNQLEEKNRQFTFLEKNEALQKDVFAQREKEQSNEIFYLKTDNMNLKKQINNIKNTFSKELHDLLVKLNTKI